MNMTPNQSKSPTPDIGAQVSMLMGATSTKTKQSELSAADKRALAQKYTSLYMGIAWQNWMRGMSLGQAWYRAMQQVNAFIATKPQNNPATDYLRQIAAANKARVEKQSLTHPNKDKHMSIPGDERDKYAAIGAKWVNSGMAGINEITGRNTPAPTKAPIAPVTNAQTAFTAAQQKLLLQWQLQNQRQRTA